MLLDTGRYTGTLTATSWGCMEVKINVASLK